MFCSLVHFNFNFYTLVQKADGVLLSLCPAGERVVWTLKILRVCFKLIPLILLKNCSNLSDLNLKVEVTGQVF